MADDVVTAELAETTFGSDRMLTGRAGPCHALPQPDGHTAITTHLTKPGAARAGRIQAGWT